MKKKVKSTKAKKAKVKPKAKKTSRVKAGAIKRLVVHRGKSTPDTDGQDAQATIRRPVGVQAVRDMGMTHGIERD